MRIALIALFMTASAGVANASPGDFLFDLLPSDPLSNQDFGDSVAISGGIIAVGAEDTNQGSVLSVGAVYLFDTATGTQLRKLTTTDPPASRAFGGALAIDGTNLIIAAEDENSSTGTAYLFDTDGVQRHKLFASNAATGAEFGQAVAISGAFAAVGSPNASPRGSAYLFDVATGLQIGDPLQPADLPSFAEFGSSLDLDGDRLIVGMDRTGVGGAAYVFDTAGALQHKILPPLDPSTNQPVVGFGRSVAISGGLAVIGATPSDGQVLGQFGRAYVYDVATGLLLKELIPDDSQAEDLFGEVVDISGNTVLVGSRREDVLGLVNRAYLFDAASGLQVGVLDDTGLVAGSEAFEAIAIDANRVVAGHEGYDSPGFQNNGRALVFDATIGNTPIGLPGDYNDDLVVDAADYTVWRDNVGEAAGTLPNDPVGGAIGEDQYATWRANYGKTADGGALSHSAAPEPSGILMLGIGAIGLTGVARRRG